MELSKELINVLQNRLKVGNRRGVHLNAIPGNSRYKFDLNRLSHIDENLPKEFIDSLLSQIPLKFKISWKDNVQDLNLLFEEEHIEIERISRSFDNLINQTKVIESEKGINTFGFGFPILIRKDKSDNKITVSPILIWSLSIKKKIKEDNTWEITRNQDDPIYVNEVLINHLQNDSQILIDQLSNEHLEDGLIDKEELIDICIKIIESINSTKQEDLRGILENKLENIKKISDKNFYEKLPIAPNNSLIEFGGLFSIFEVQKNNIIKDYNNLLGEVGDLFESGLQFDRSDMVDHFFQPLSSVDTDPSQQSILNSLNKTRNILIQGPPGTGKSQSLTALLVNALENKKKTLVVCEKRTALEVLQRQLDDRGLDKSSILIKDIIKDRRKVVNSVRERVDNSEYKKYTYEYSPERLKISIKESNSLIKNINNTHIKINEKILGDRNWTDVVGYLLKEARSISNDEKLDLNKCSFDYNETELKHFIGILNEGERLYDDYKKIIALSFIKSSKFSVDNPFILEKKIKEDFSYYESKKSEILQITGQYKDDYHKIRTDEILSQNKSIKNAISILRKYVLNSSDLIDSFKKDYKIVRQKEIDKEIIGIKPLINELKSIIKSNTENELFFDEDILNSFGYKIKSIFSKKIKNIINDRKKIKDIIIELDDFLANSKDINNIRFKSKIVELDKNLNLLKENINKIKSNSQNQIESEILGLDCDSFFSENIKKQNFFKNLINIKNYRSEDFNLLVEKLLTELTNGQKEIKHQAEEVSKIANTSKDIPNIKFLNTIKLIDLDSEKYLIELKNHAETYDQLLKDEINALDITEFIPIQYRTSNYDKLFSEYINIKQRINDDFWCNSKIKAKNGNTILKEINELLTKKDAYFKDKNDAFSIEYDWFKFYNSYSKDSVSVNGKLLHCEIIVIDQLIDKKDWKEIFTVNYLESLLVNLANKNLPQSDENHIKLTKSLSQLGQEQIKLIKDYWYTRQIEATREFYLQHKNITVENVYNKKSSKNHKRLSLREIVKLDIDLFTSFFPIILTTPDVASNLFQKQNKYFDIVMFDEASQLRLEDTLPAILKGKQVIVAGDEHQMPPSNYFSKIFDGVLEDEEEIDDDENIKRNANRSLIYTESLLDFATEVGFDKQFLDFHYRSRHPYLIDFSNNAFYNQRLKPLPNEIDYIPINYININGTYSDNSNDKEADAVLSIIENNILKMPSGEYPSVGIATFNIKQRNLILNKINQRKKFEQYSDFNNKILELEKNGFFVKNLETIQGDERDVIILSTTFGVNKDGKFYQRFGSINQNIGYKLLNVIVTRAKYKVFVCTSIPEEIFLNYKELLAIDGNNKRAAFFAYLAYAKAVHEKNNDARQSVLDNLNEYSTNKLNINQYNDKLESPFEEEVYNALIENFDKSKLIPQLKYAGFRIDIVYESNIKGVPKIAIECDGASYHSSQEAYLNDIHRQKILEDCGFVFHRIWSTKWWRNPKGETNRLVEFIKEIENKHTINSHDKLNKKDDKHFDIINSLNDEINFDFRSNLIDRNIKLDADIINHTSNEKTELIRKDRGKSVNENSVLEIKYLSIDKKIKIKLTSNKSDKIKKSNGVQEIFIMSPLGAALIDKFVGDTVKIGGLDKYVEIINIL